MLRNRILDEIEKNKGILKLAPCWVSRKFMIPGMRMKLDRRDIYAYGVTEGGINERWLASTTNATKNSPDDSFGQSRIVLTTEENMENEEFLKDAIECAGIEILGPDMMKKHGGWKIYSKFFDNKGPISFHLHMMQHYASEFGGMAKPEAYYYPPQMNFTDNNFPYTFFGIEPGTTKEELLECIINWEKDKSDIIKYSKAYKLEVGTGWDVPAGIIHAPGSLVTYEPQCASDINVFYENVIEGRYNPRNPAQYLDKYDAMFLIDNLDWEKNIDPNFRKNRFRMNIPVKDVEAMAEDGYIEKWICYGRNDFCAKELTVFPGRSVTIKDNGPYGLIMVQGYGLMNNVKIETPTMIRFNQHTNDEKFVVHSAAKEGVVITNESSCEDLVMLKHFGPDNMDAQHLVRDDIL